MAEAPADAARPHPHARRSARCPARVTMPLLTLITQQSLDEDYVHVAERRAAGDAPRPQRGRPRRTAAVVVAVFGLLVAMAAVQTSRNAGVDDASRETLISQITGERQTVSRLQDRIVQTAGAATPGSRNELTAGHHAASRAAVAAAASARGRAPASCAVTGPGRPDHGRRRAPAATPTHEVKRRGPGQLVDGLWNAGAEAISINGQRLTVLSAIRNASVGHPRERQPARAAVHRAGDRRHPHPAGEPARQHPRRRSSTAWPTASGSCYELHNEDSLTLPAAPSSCSACAASGRQRSRQDQDRPTTDQEDHAVIAALGLLVGIVLGLIFQPDVPARPRALPADRRRRRPRRGLRRPAGLPRRHLRRQGLRGLVLQQRRDRRGDRLPRRQARASAASCRPASSSSSGSGSSPTSPPSGGTSSMPEPRDRRRPRPEPTRTPRAASTPRR